MVLKAVVCWKMNKSSRLFWGPFLQGFGMSFLVEGSGVPSAIGIVYICFKIKIPLSSLWISSL